jgi:hypothetical protein
MRIVVLALRRAMKVEAAARLAGYSGHGSFYRAFEAVTGRTPAAIRRVPDVDIEGLFGGPLEIRPAALLDARRTTWRSAAVSLPRSVA